MEDKMKSWTELTRIVNVLNDIEDEREGDDFKRNDIDRAKGGNKSAIVRVRKAIQSVRKLAPEARGEAQVLKP